MLIVKSLKVAESLDFLLRLVRSLDVVEYLDFLFVPPTVNDFHMME